MTAQEIFDKVSTHLLAQGEPSLWGGGRAYRGDGGTSCAVGCLIPDDAYDPSIEASTLNHLIANRANHRPSMKAWLDAVAEHEVLLCHLQHIHDYRDPYTWHTQLKRAAEMHNLEFKHAQN